MKNGQKLAAFLLFGALVCGLVFWSSVLGGRQAPEQDKAVGGAAFTVDGEKYYLTPGTGITVQAGALEATTSVNFLKLAGSASSTVQGWTGRATSIDLNIQETASTTGSKLLFTTYFSPNGIDWYCEDGSVLDSAISQTHGAGCLVHFWTPGVTATTSRNISIPAVQSRWFKTVFSATVADVALYVQAIPKEVTPN